MPLATTPTEHPGGDSEPQDLRGAFARLRSRALEPVDPSSLAAHRILFGSLMLVASLRFVHEGWVVYCFDQPSYFFHYWGFDFVRVFPHDVMVALFFGMAVLAGMVTVGLHSRVAAAVFGLVFTYVELLDVTNYLNHHVLVGWLAFLHVLVPTDAAHALRPSRVARVPRVALWSFRLQVGVVYAYAALAKAGPDWLLHGQPLELWFSSRGDTPIVGPILNLPYVALAASWAGFLNDALAVPLLSFRRTRPYGLAMVFAFHSLTNVFFNIGIFPFLMMMNATLFLEPDWPRRLWARARGLAAAAPAGPTWAASPRASRALLAFVVLFGTGHVLFPLRTFAYGGNVLWHEQGMRFSWRVMLRQKMGDVVYRVKHPDGRVTYAYPHTYLTSKQERELVGQPDLILQLAHHVGEDMARRTGHPVQVYADAFVSLNGRAPARLIRPDVDLMTVHDGVLPARYVTPSPGGPPVTFFAGRDAAH